MLQLFTSDKYPVVTLSASHVVFTSNTTKYAGDLVPGDTLLHWTGVQMMELVISEIKPSLESGYWAPMTRAGTLLVDGYLMSCYASYPHQVRLSNTHDILDIHDMPGIYSNYSKPPPPSKKVYFLASAN